MQFKPDTKTNKLQSLSTLADSILIEPNCLCVSGRLHKPNFSFFIVLIVAKLKKETSRSVTLLTFMFQISKISIHKYLKIIQMNGSRFNFFAYVWNWQRRVFHASLNLIWIQIVFFEGYEGLLYDHLVFL